MNKDLTSLYYLSKRNVILYFKDKMTFFVSLITPMILLILFVTFLNDTYKDSINNIFSSVSIDNKLIDAFTGGWLFSSVLSTSTLTVAFCSGIMVIDKINNVDIDFKITPVKPFILKLSYVLSNLISTLIIAFILLIIGMIYLAFIGFYLSAIDILLIITNIILSSLFATLLANIIWTFTRSSGAMSGICTLVSALYGFICGAYMPINSMGKHFQYITSFIPGTYSTIIFRKTFLNGVLNKMGETAPSIMIDEVAKAFDVKFYFFDFELNLQILFILSISFIVILFIILLIVSLLRDKKENK